MWSITYSKLLTTSAPYKSQTNEHGGPRWAAELAGRDWGRGVAEPRPGTRRTRQDDASHLRPQPPSAPSGCPSVHVLLGFRWGLKHSTSRINVGTVHLVQVVLLPLKGVVTLNKSAIVMYVACKCSSLSHPGSYFCYDNPAALQTQVIKVSHMWVKPGCSEVIYFFFFLDKCGVLTYNRCQWVSKYLILFLPVGTRIWTWTPSRSCSCTPGTLGLTSSSASSAGSCSTGCLASGRKRINHIYFEFCFCFLCCNGSERVVLFSFKTDWAPSSFPCLSVSDRYALCVH